MAGFNRLTRVSFAVAVAIAALLYSRAGALYLLYANAPQRMPRINNVKNLQIRFADQVRNCEDMAIDTFEGFAILSCDPGRDTWNTVMGPLKDPNSPPGTGLYLWDYDDPESKPELIKLEKFEDKARIFHPVGIDYLPIGRKLFVVNHSPEGLAVEIFKLQSSDRKASHVRTMSHELLSAPNSIAAFNNSQFFATNDHYFKQDEAPFAATLETYLAMAGGSVVHGDRPRRFRPGADDLRVKILDNLAFANGVTFLNSTTLAVASTSRQTVNLYNIVADAEDDHPSLDLIHQVIVPFYVDNVKSDKRGTLFMAGHPFPPSIEHLAANNAKCNANGLEGSKGKGCDDVKGQSWISQWSERDGLEHVYAGDDYPTSSTFVKDAERGLGMAVGLYAKGVLTWET